MFNMQTHSKGLKFIAHSAAAVNPKTAVPSRMDTDEPSAAKPQTKRGLCTFPSLSVPSVPRWWNLLWQSFGDHEFNQRDAEDTERANNRKQRVTNLTTGRRI